MTVRPRTSTQARPSSASGGGPRAAAARARCSGGASKSSSPPAVVSVRARPGPSGALTVSHSESSPYGGFVWAHRALNRPKRRFPARADPELAEAVLILQAPMGIGNVWAVLKPLMPAKTAAKVSIVGAGAGVALDVKVILTPPCIFH